MTKEQWRLLRPGDIVIDLHTHNHARRKIHSMTEVRNTRGQRPGLARYALTVDNLKSTGRRTMIFVSDNTGPPRFELDAPAIAAKMKT